jgi:hypothetical protein
MIRIFAGQHSEDRKSIRSQMLYPLSYERSQCSILHSKRSGRVQPLPPTGHSRDRASDLLILDGLET